jgi:hypothetical protein
MARSVHESFYVISLIDIDKLTENRKFSSAFGNSVSTRLRSCENKFVTTPVSVLVKKLKGAPTSVCKAALWMFAPTRCTETIKTTIPSSKSEKSPETWKKAYSPA